MRVRPAASPRREARWAPHLQESDDPLLGRIARLGDAHEARILDSLLADPNQEVVQLGRARTSRAELERLHAATLEAFSNTHRTVFQAGFFDGEFHGYADFVEWTDDGWLVSDAKLARQAGPKALLQLGAYVDQLRRAGLKVSDTCALLLGDGSRQTFPVADIIPVFRERRARLRAILGEHRASGEAITWSDDRYVACGRCDECSAAAEAAQDLSLVAGLRMD